MPKFSKNWYFTQVDVTVPASLQLNISFSIDYEKHVPF